MHCGSGWVVGSWSRSVPGTPKQLCYSSPLSTDSLCGLQVQGLLALLPLLLFLLYVPWPCCCRFGRYLGAAVPLVVQYGQKAEEGDDELREYVLQVRRGVGRGAEGVCGEGWEGGRGGCEEGCGERWEGEGG